MTDKFELTPDHIKLLRHAYVRWDDSEFGAPAIDSKRPYGNSGVLVDIFEILMDRAPEEDEISQYLEDRFTILHDETEAALQIILQTGRFAPGIYEQDNHYQWKLTD